MNLKNSTIIEESKDKHLPQGPLHKMELLKKEIDPYWIVRTLMIENKVALKYYREAISTTIYTLN